MESRSLLTRPSVAELDPLSQLLGGLTNQVSNIARDVGILRDEVITNRSQGTAWREEMTHKLDLVQAEYRNVKHDYRAFETAKVAMDSRMKELEAMLTKWRVKATAILTAASLIGAVAGAVTEPFVHYGLTRLFG